MTWQWSCHNLVEHFMYTCNRHRQTHEVIQQVRLEPVKRVKSLKTVIGYHTQTKYLLGMLAFRFQSDKGTHLKKGQPPNDRAHALVYNNRWNHCFSLILTSIFCFYLMWPGLHTQIVNNIQCICFCQSLGPLFVAIILYSKNRICWMFNKKRAKKKNNNNEQPNLSGDIFIVQCVVMDFSLNIL